MRWHSIVVFPLCPLQHASLGKGTNCTPVYTARQLGIRLHLTDVSHAHASVHELDARTHAHTQSRALFLFDARIPDENDAKAKRAMR